MKVFVDNCIFSLSGFARTVYKTQSINLNGVDHEIDILGFERVPMPDLSEHWKRVQVECLPTIARLAKEKTINLHTYSELQFEGWRASRVEMDLFKDVEVIWLDPIVERSYFMKMDMGEYISNERMIDFCKWLLSLQVKKLPDKLRANPRFPDRLRDNFSKIDRFQTLCDGLPEKMYPDVLHFWTAEENHMDYFLTVDKKFINVMTNTKKIKSTCNLISPEDFVKELGVVELDKFELEEGVVYNVFGNPMS